MLVPVFVRAPLAGVALEMTPESVAKSPDVVVLSSTCTVRVALLRSIGFWKSRFASAVVELSIMLPLTNPFVVPQVSAAPLEKLTLRVPPKAAKPPVPHCKVLVPAVVVSVRAVRSPVSSITPPPSDRWLVIGNPVPLVARRGPVVIVVVPL